MPIFYSRSLAATSARQDYFCLLHKIKYSDIMWGMGIEHLHMEVKMGLAENLRRRRVRAGLTQAALAEAVGVSQPTIAAMEGGVTRNPKTSVLLRLAGVLNASLDELLMGTGEEGHDAAEPA
jgi:DNA-binding XRE family transcriptional regulator